MEAAKILPKKSVSKGKIKKTMKNVLCRPDPVFWPLIKEDSKRTLEKCLSKYKMEIPPFQKPHWNELKLLPKEKRPKPPKLKKVDGLLFGISECSDALKSKECAAVLIEASVNPKIIVQPVIDACIDSRIPVICVNDLRTITTDNFGIPTACLGLKHNHLLDIQQEVTEMAQCYKEPSDKPMLIEQTSLKPNAENTVIEKPFKCPFLYRTDKKSRVFVPDTGKISHETSKFCGQDFIKISGNVKPSSIDRKSYMKMILNKVSNNPNRVKVKK